MSDQKGHPSIEATGAKHGDTVRCVGKRDRGDVERFVVGQTYPVVSHCGRPAAHGITDYGTKPGGKGGERDPGWRIPWLGFGYFWEKVE